MEPIQVNAVLLRGLLPDLRLTVGATLAGRVVERHGAHGLLNLAGAILVAELPDEVAAGQRLRLAVQEVSAERVVLRVLPDGPAAGAPAPPPAAPAGSIALPLPGGAEAHVALQVEEDEGGGGGGGASRAVTVHFTSEMLGRIEVRLVLGAGGLVAGVGAPAGAPLALAGARAPELRAALQRVMGTAVDVHVGAHRGRVDLRA